MHKHKAYARWPIEHPIIPTSDSFVDPPSPLESASDEPPPLEDTSTENTDDEGADDRTSAPTTVYDTGATAHVVPSMGASSGAVAEGNFSAGGNERTALAHNLFHFAPGRVATNLPGRPHGLLVTTDNACLGFNSVTRPAHWRYHVYHPRPAPQFRALVTAHDPAHDPEAGNKGG
jgi:hypothetical protein